MNKANNKKNVSKQQNKNTSNKNRRRPPPQPRSLKFIRRETFQLSNCSRLYLSALCDPFKPVANVCIPDTNDVPSAKYRTVTRAVMHVGLNGFGYTVISSSSKTSNLPMALLTMSTFPDIYVHTGALAEILQVKDSRCPYTEGNYANVQVMGRVVAAGVRARYIGTALQASGQIICLRVPAHQNVAGSSIAELLLRPEARTYPCDRAWHGIAYHPTRTDDLEYTYTTGAIVPDTGVGSNMIIAVAGATPGNAFEVEIVRYYEFIPSEQTSGPGVGIATIVNMTDSHSDPTGFGQVRNYFGKLDSDSTPGPSMYDRALKWISETSVEDVSKVVMTAQKSATLASSAASFLM